jgi:Flp pilus assembly protein TadG
MAAITTLRARVRGERGAELIEFSLILPMLLLIILGILDFGFLFLRYEVVTNAAREGARVRVLPGYTHADTVARVTQFLDASSLDDTPTVPDIPVAAVDIGGACMTLATVTVTYPHSYMFVGPLLTFFGGSAFTRTSISATATMRYEGAAMACP